MKSLIKPGSVILAPMQGVNDPAFRALCCEQGADITFLGMVSAQELSELDGGVRPLLGVAQGERCVSVQLIGHSPRILATQAARIETELGDALAWIDVNMGCSSHDVVAQGDGAALMKDPVLASRIVRQLKAAVSVPVSAKFRRGFDIGSETAADFAKRLEQAGADAITVHGRYAGQYYQGPSDWGVVARVKQAAGIPVIGNGDVRCGADARALIEQTGCDGVMIARAAIGNPWVFAQARAALALQDEPAPPLAHIRIQTARRHVRGLENRNGDAVKSMRRHALRYVYGLVDTSLARRLFACCVTPADYLVAFDLLEDLLEQAS